MQIYEEDSPNYCHECQKGFSRKFNYEHHILTIHGGKKEQFKESMIRMSHFPATFATKIHPSGGRGGPPNLIFVVT